MGVRRGEIKYEQELREEINAGEEGKTGIRNTGRKMGGKYSKECIEMEDEKRKGEE